jgi:hypothetical protein
MVEAPPLGHGKQASPMNIARLPRSLSEALIQGTITTRPAFIEVFLEDNKLYYRLVDSQKTEGVLLYEN